mmetsp:Transcript_29863/g.95208  ORF Transcript_29863/g.95208 Transcript_29863/m.95208 type:complete len:86 (+) Transcript_29863:430-687(+)
MGRWLRRNRAPLAAAAASLRYDLGLMGRSPPSAQQPHGAAWQRQGAAAAGRSIEQWRASAALLWLAPSRSCECCTAWGQFAMRPA